MIRRSTRNTKKKDIQKDGVDKPLAATPEVTASSLKKTKSHTTRIVSKKFDTSPRPPAKQSGNQLPPDSANGGPSGHYHNQQIAATTSVVSLVNKPEIPIKKMERSHSFHLARKLSKIYNTITGSKDNLAQIAENELETSTVTAAIASPTTNVSYKFTRSLTMAAIPIRQSLRRVFRETRLEKLHEENDSKEATVPDVRGRPKSFAADTVEERSSEQRHYFLNQLKRTFSSTPSDKTEKIMNPRWSASLASLQQIDMMVSYEDLSFINYDVFNTYEKQLEKIHPHSPRQKTNINFQEDPSSQPSPVVSSTAVRRRQHQEPKFGSTMHIGTTSTSDIDTNFDQKRNLYRQSLDDKKLKFLNRVTLDSYRWSNNLERERTTEDVYMLDNYIQTPVTETYCDNNSKSRVLCCEKCVFTTNQRLSLSLENIRTIPELLVLVSE